MNSLTRQLQSALVLITMILSDFVEYNKESPTGLVWKARDPDAFKTQRAASCFNNNLAGRPAGYLNKDQNGYQSWKIEIQGRSFTCGRVLWEITSGPIPKGMLVDHRDNNALNNHPANLRLATRTQNKCNAFVRKDSMAGVKGVQQNRSGKWIARIGKGGKTYLGGFPSLEEASQAYRLAAINQHGEFARTS